MCVCWCEPAEPARALPLPPPNVAIYLDRTFNLVDFLQVAGRIHGCRNRSMQIVVLVAESTIDEFIDFQPRARSIVWPATPRATYCDRSR